MAVKVNWPPMFTVGELVVTTAVGRGLETTGEIPEGVAATTLYVESPAKLKTAL